MMTTIHEVYETVRDARADGPDALAAVAMSFGAAMALGTLRNTALKALLAETRAALEAAEATVATLRTERDAASAAAQAARQRMEEVREQCDRARDDAEMCARQRDEARSRASMLAQDLARAVEERDDARARVAMEERERDRAVQEREAFSLRLSAAERERDEARAALDAAIARPTYEARTVAPTIAEWRGHFRAGGSWLVLRPQWVPLVTILRGAYLSGADLRGAARSTDDAPISGWTVTDGRLVREVSP